VPSPPPLFLSSFSPLSLSLLKEVELLELGRRRALGGRLIRISGIR
jgi:hypothetical protein